jgi:predicted Zn-dependent protease
VSGSGNFGGTTFQSDTIAFVAVHIVTGTKLRWLPDVPDDTPTAVSGEVGGSGDDLSIEFGGRIASVEVQAKHGLQGGKSTIEAFEAIRNRTTNGHHPLVFLAVDPTASRVVRSELPVDLDRLRSGRTDGLKDAARSLLALGAEMESTAKRVHVITLALDRQVDSSVVRALELLAENLEDASQAASAWDLLQTEAARICANRGRLTGASLIEALKAAGIRLKPARQTRRWHDDLRHSKKLLESEDAEAALALLRQIEADAGDKADRGVLYRISQHRAAAYLLLGRFKDAIGSAHKSLDHDSTGVHALVNLANALALDGQLDEAAGVAQRATELHPQSSEAWIVRTHVALDREQLPLHVPDEVANTRAYRLGLLRLHLFRGNGEDAVALSEVLLGEGPRTPDLLFYRMEALSLELGQASSRDRSDRASDVERLAAEVLGTDLESASSFRRRVLVRRAIARRILGKDEQAAEDIRAIREIDADDPDALLQEAQLHISAGRPEKALELLQRHSLSETPFLLAMRCILLAESGKVDEARKDLDAALQALPAALDGDGLRAALAEAAIELKEAALAQRLLDQTTDDYKKSAEFSTLSGRLAATQGDFDEAERLYDDASNRNPHLKDRLLAELASHFLKAKKYDHALRVYSAAAVVPRAAKRAQIKTLFALDRLKEAYAVIQELALEGPLPDWALAYAAEIAVRRNDPFGVVDYLEQLAEREGAGPDSRLVLVQTLIGLGRTDQARDHAQRLATESLDPREAMALSHLWLQLREPDKALPLALHAYRSAPNDPELSRAFASAVLSSRTSPTEVDKVEADTHVTLRSTDGSTLEYVMFSEPAAFRINNEISLEEASVLGLVGLRAGDTFVQNPGAFFEVRFKVEKIQSSLTYAFQDAIANYGKRFPTAPFFVVGFNIKTEAPTISDFQPLIDSAHQRERKQQSVLEIYRQQALPLDFTARMAQVDICALMAELGRSGSNHVLIVEYSDDSGVQLSRAAARDATRVVLTRSALFTMDAFDFRRRIGGMEWIAPRSLRDDLRAELNEADTRVREGERVFGTGARGLALSEWPANHPTLVARRDALTELLSWFDTNVTVMPRPLEVFDDPKRLSVELRSSLGDAAVDALELARHTPAVLYADDLGLRRFALEQQARSFSSVSLLQVMAERGTISAQERDRLLIVLLEHHYQIVRPTPELLAEAAKPDKSPAARRAAFQALSNGALDLVQAARTLAGSVRSASIQPVRTTATEEIVRLGLEALTQVFATGPTVQLVARLAESELALLPEQLQVTKDTCAAFRKGRLGR